MKPVSRRNRPAQKAATTATTEIDEGDSRSISSHASTLDQTTLTPGQKRSRHDSDSASSMKSMETRMSTRNTRSAEHNTISHDLLPRKRRHLSQQTSPKDVYSFPGESTTPVPRSTPAGYRSATRKTKSQATQIEDQDETGSLLSVDTLASVTTPSGAVTLPETKPSDELDTASDDHKRLEDKKEGSPQDSDNPVDTHTESNGAMQTADMSMASLSSDLSELSSNFSEDSDAESVSSCGSNTIKALEKCVGLEFEEERQRIVTHALALCRKWKDSWHAMDRRVQANARKRERNQAARAQAQQSLANGRRRR